MNPQVETHPPTLCLIAVVLGLVVGSSNGLLCRQCFSLTSWDECDRVARDQLCTTVGVNSSHLGLLHDNPTLTLGNHSRFRCFKYRALISRHDSGAWGLVTGHGRGCTFAEGDFCSGWKPSVAVKECDVCDDRNLCNGTVSTRYCGGRTVVALLGVVVAAVAIRFLPGRYN